MILVCFEWNTKVALKVCLPGIEKCNMTKVSLLIYIIEVKNEQNIYFIYIS